MTAYNEQSLSAIELRNRYNRTLERRSLQSKTERVKELDGSAPQSPESAWGTAINLWNMANTIDSMDRPLVQLRAIIRASNETRLIENQRALQNDLGEYAHVTIPGCIPYELEGEQYGLYYLHIANPERRRYMYPESAQNIDQQDAIRRGLAGREKAPKELPQNIKIATITGHNGQITQVCCDLPVNVSEDELISQLIKAHQASFAFPHDKNQRTRDGLQQMLEANPMVVAFDEKDREVAGVGLLEVDDRFTHGDIALIEPTYFTDPKYREHGISQHLRRHTQILFAKAHPAIYRGREALVFNESIRNTSFGISIASGCSIPVGYSGQFDGNLGDAYTYIGPSNPVTGLMPMGLTFHGNSDLSVYQK